MKYSRYIKFWDCVIGDIVKIFKRDDIVYLLILALILIIILSSNVGFKYTIIGLLLIIVIIVAILFALCFISYPFRYMKVKRLVKSGKCFSKESAGKILFCSVFNVNKEYLEHDWSGCKCWRCGETRDEQHDWKDCVCKQCGKDKHDWGDDGCVCMQCGKENHDWESVGGPDYNYHYIKCKKCGEETIS